MNENQIVQNALQADAPRYRQIAADIWSQIQAGVLAAGSKLPSEGDLALKYGVARLTLRQALIELQKLGAVEVRRGVGSFVMTPPDLVEVVSHVPSARQLKDATIEAIPDSQAPHRSARPVRSADEQVLSYGPAVGALAQEAAHHLGVAADSLIRLDTAMTHLDRSWVANSYWYSREWEKLPDFVEEHRLVIPAFLYGFGVDLQYLWRAFSATSADFQDASTLNVATGTALLVRDGVSADEEGKPVFYARRRMRGDSAKFVLRYV